MDKVVKYVRIPVKNQKEILEEQQKELMQYAEERGFKVAKTGVLRNKTEKPEKLKGMFIDVGTNTNTFMNYKNAFFTMLGEAKKGKFNQILIKDINEFIKANAFDLVTSFGMADSMEEIRQLKECGVNVYFTKEKINSIDEEKEDVLNDLFSVATNEFVKKTKRIYKLKD